MKLRKSDVKDLLAKSFPDYRGRSFELVEQKTIYFDPYGGGGSWSDFVLIDLATGESRPYPKPIAGPFGDKNAYRDIPLADGTVLVEHATFCGKDCGITFHVTPTTRLSLPFAALEIPA